MSGYEGKHPDDLVPAANKDAPKSLRDEFALALLPSVMDMNGRIASLAEDIRHAYRLADEAMKIRKE
jgi:hypothetical protein